MIFHLFKVLDEFGDTSLIEPGELNQLFQPEIRQRRVVFYLKSIRKSYLNILIIFKYTYLNLLIWENKSIMKSIT